MNKNTSSDSNCNTELQTQEQKKNSIEVGAPEASEKSFLAYLLDKYKQDGSENKGEFKQKFNRFVQEKSIYAANLTSKLDLSKLIFSLSESNNKIVFDGKEFAYLINDKEDIIDIIWFILEDKIISSSSFLSLGKSLAEEIIKNKNAEPDDASAVDNDGKKQNKQSENENVKWTRAEYKKQLMSVIEREGTVFDLKLQKEMLPGSQYGYCRMVVFMPGSINDSSILLELLEKGKQGGVDSNNIITKNNIYKFADNSIGCLDDLLDYSKEKDTQKIDFNNLKLKLVDGSIRSLSKLLKYFDGIDLYNLDSITEEKINTSKVKGLLSALDNLKYFAPEAFLDLFDNETSLLSNPKVCKLLNVKEPQDEKDNVWKLKLKLVFMYIITFGLYHFLEYDKGAIDEIAKVEYRNGDYFEKIKGNCSKWKVLLSSIFKNNKRSKEKLTKASKNAKKDIDKVEPLMSAATKLKKDNTKVDQRI